MVPQLVREWRKTVVCAGCQTMKEEHFWETSHTGRPFPLPYGQIQEKVELGIQRGVRRLEGVVKFYPLNLLKKCGWERRRDVLRGAVQAVVSLRWEHWERAKATPQGRSSGRHFMASLSLLFGHKKLRWVSFNSLFSVWHNWNLMLLRFRNNVLGELFFLCENGRK